MISESAVPTAPSQPSLDRVSQERLLQVLEGAIAVRRRHQLYLWSQGLLHGVLPHSLLVCALRDPATGSVRADCFSTVPVPDDSFRRVCESGSGLLARITSAWVEEGGHPILLRPGDPRFRDAQDPALGGGSGAIAMHGTFDQSGASGSAFLFFDVDPGPPGRCARLLEMLVPCLHSALVRVSIGPDRDALVASSRATLTPREIAILRYVQRGLSNTDIGRELSISPLTVKNHVQKVLRKLAVPNRAQAAAKATMLRVIPPLARGGD